MIILGCLGWVFAGFFFMFARGEREESRNWQEMYMRLSDGEHSIDKWVRDAKDERVNGIRRK